MEQSPRQPAKRLLLWASGLTLLALVAWVSFLLGRASARPGPLGGPPAPAITAAASATGRAAQPTRISPTTLPKPTSSAAQPTAIAAATPTALPTSPPAPTTVPSPAVTAAPTSPIATATHSPDELEQHMIAVINQLRREQGCDVALRRSPALTAAARSHSRDMADNHFFDHRGSDASDRISRAEAAGYAGMPGTRVRENIGAGAVPADVAGYWIELDDIHRSQVLDCTYNDIGAGYAMGDGTPYTHYWTVNFGIGVR